MIGARENSFLSQQLNDFLVQLQARPIIKILLNLSKGFMKLSSIQSYELAGLRACLVWVFCFHYVRAKSCGRIY
jgi:hypothetical protein